MSHNNVCRTRTVWWTENPIVKLAACDWAKASPLGRDFSGMRQIQNLQSFGLPSYLFLQPNSFLPLFSSILSDPVPTPIVMLSKRVLVASKFLRAQRAPHYRCPFPLQQFRYYADKIVKVPEMAESISEGTLKQWSKQIGDFVELDEEIATIETDKVGLHALLTSYSQLIKLHSDRCSSQCFCGRYDQGVSCQ